MALHILYLEVPSVPLKREPRCHR